MSKVTVAATQMSCTNDIDQNIAKAEQLVLEAIQQNAQIILLQELFETLYFCQQQTPAFFKYATEVGQNKAIRHFQSIAKKHEVVLPISFFERYNQARYNSLVVIDADGEIMGTYRKTHIPDGPGYEEKYYFNPGDTGFKIWKTRYATFGVGICWDQWFPETARCMALMGSELLFYPTAIGSEPHDSSIDSKDHWQRCMQGHAAANLMPVIASNRIGTEHIGNSQITFYGSSFITDETGAFLQVANRQSPQVLVQSFDLNELQLKRDEWGLFKDRRPLMYKTILSSDGYTML